jgi:hypothetical protein
MAVKPLRRIGAPASDTLYDHIEAQFLRSGDWRARLDALEREHPELIVRNGSDVLAALPRGDARLVYGYENERSFLERFPSMFKKLLPQVRRAIGRGTVRIGLE